MYKTESTESHLSPAASTHYFAYRTLYLSLSWQALQWEGASICHNKPNQDMSKIPCRLKMYKDLNLETGPSSSKTNKIISYHLFLKTLIYVNIGNFATTL